LLQGFYDVLVTRSLPGLFVSGALMALFFALAAGVYFRQWWAYWGAVFALSAVLLTVIIGVFFPIDLTVIESELLSGFDPAIANFLGPLAGLVGDALRGLQITAVIIALFFAVFRVGADFDQVTVRETAELKKGLKLAADYHLNARRLAKRGQWAAAVLHWQRAAALAPRKYTYLRHLGAAYGRLGHYARSLDVLQSARAVAREPAQEEDVARLITAVAQRQQHDHE
jgi:tetratricopeptide (TPR) repeat protein